MMGRLAAPVRGTLVSGRLGCLVEHRPSAAGWLTAAGIVFLLAWFPLPLHAGPLPRVAVSLPPGIAFRDIVRTIQSSGARDVVIVLPSVRFDIGSAATTPGLAPGTIATAAQAGEPEIYLHVIVTLSEVAGTGREREGVIEGQLRELLRSLALDKQPVKGLIVDVPNPGPAADLFQFTLATLVVMAKSVRPDLHVSVMLPPGSVAGRPDVSRRIAAYADSLVFPAEILAGDGLARVAELLAGKPFVLRTAGTTGQPDQAVRALLDVLVASRTPVADTVWIDVPALPELRALCASLQFLGRSLAGGFELAAPESMPAAVMLDGKPATAAVAFVGSQTADMAALVRAAAKPDAPRQIGIVQPSGRAARVSCHDAFDGRSLPDSTTASGPGCRADAEYVFLRVSQGGGDQRLFEAVNVKGRADLRVEEIIARWQASRETERRLLDNWSAPCFLTLHFDSTSFGMSFDVALELQRFTDRTGINDWVQSGFFVNGVRFSKGQEFPLPMLEPEKVVTQPLELSMDEKYNYRLAGTDTVNGTLCYVIDIEPAEPTELLYAGKVWIDGVKFRQVRLQLEQRTGKHNIASHVETQDFGVVRDAQGREFTLPQRIFVEESLNVAGRPVTLEKIYKFGDHAINVADFQARLEAARSSDSPMYRDTDAGLRTLRKEGGARVVEPAPGKRIRSLVGGALYDASYSFPVPLAGVSWVDFDFRGTGAQLSAVFAGVFLAGNLSNQSRPNLRRSVEFSVSALPATDRIYAGTTELKGQQFRLFEQWVGAIVSWQASSSWTLTASSHATFQLYQRTSSTDKAFRTPGSGVVLRAWGEAKYARKSLDASVLVEPAVRVVGGSSFGYPDAPVTPERAWVKYQAQVDKHVYAGKLTRGGVSGSYYGGVNLDRLSRYHTSFLTTPRILGIPNGVDSFDTIVIAGAYYGFNLLELAKLQGSYNHAWARNLDESRRFKQFDGLALDLGTAGPRGMYVQASVSLALRGNLSRYSSRWGVMVMCFKPMRK
jgi:hypothetical protein